MKWKARLLLFLGSMNLSILPIQYHSRRRTAIFPEMTRSQILIEGYTKDELVAFGDLEALAINGEPIVFRVGTADVLGQFSRHEDVLIAELAVVEGGGDGVLVALIDAVEF